MVDSCFFVDFLIKRESKRGRGWYFFGAVGLLYGFLFLMSREMAEEAIEYWFWLLRQFLFVFFVIVILVFLIQLFSGPRALVDHFNVHKSLGWLIAILGGVFSMGSIYMWYPLMDKFRRGGVRDAFIATFLYNRAVKVQLLPLFVYYFGLRFVVIMTSYMIIFSVLGGLLVERLNKIGTD